MTTRDVNSLFAQAEIAFQAGRLAEAETLLRSVRKLVPDHHRPWHLSALVAERAGSAGDALAAFREAVTRAPNDAGLIADFADRLGDVDADGALKAYARALVLMPRLTNAYLGRARLLHRLARYADSRADFLRVYQLEPQRIDGWLGRGAMERDAAIPASAAIAFDRALAIDPANVAALAGRASCALELGEEGKAVSGFAAAAQLAPGDRTIAMSEAEAREFAGEDAPDRRLAVLVAQDPRWVAGQALLGRMLWEGGAPDFDRGLREAVASAPDDVALHDALVTLLAGVDRFAEAADAAHAASRATGESHFDLAEAAHAGSAGDVVRAEALFARLPPALPARALHEARHRIRRGELDRARMLLEPLVEQYPADVSAWALTDLVWRATGDPRAEWLHGQPGLIRRHALALDGDTVLGIADHLRLLHHRVRHPVGQSMRGGTQTRGRLLSRQDPLLVRLRVAIGEAVMAHWNGLPPRDDRHPLLRHRDRTPTLSGSWSVRLTGGGHHVAHIHPQGLLSSASYWVVPSDAEQEQGEQGRLEVGRPPEDLGLALAPVASFAPELATLVLFPSTLFHNTRTFGAGERITVAFDIAAE